MKNPLIRDPIDTKIYGNCGIITRFQTERERGEVDDDGDQDAGSTDCPLPNRATQSGGEERGGDAKT